MRAFVDWQLQQMNKQGLFLGSAVLVKPLATGDSQQLNDQNGLYTVIINGIQDQRVVNECEIVTSVSRMIDPYMDYEAFLALAEDDRLEFITSNTTEAGIAYLPEDTLDGGTQKSFPGKLTALLYRRFQLGKKGFIIIPCELIDRNGEKLREIILRYASEWNLGPDFARWLEQENTFCCSLVDRIVPGYPHDRAEKVEAELGYQDKMMVISEPYLLWVIEGPPWLADRLPLAQAGLNVLITDDMTPYRERKVYLLNGPHTAMASLGLLADLCSVEDVMKDEVFSAFVARLIQEEIIPMVDLPQDDLHSYAEAILDRFRNPFIRHELTSIYLNSISKFKARLLPILLRYSREHGKVPKLITLVLAGLLLGYRRDRLQPQDSPEVLDKFREAWTHPETLVSVILGNADLWGQDLSLVPGLVPELEADLNLLENLGSREVLEQYLEVRL